MVLNITLPSGSTEGRRPPRHGAPGSLLVQLRLAVSCTAGMGPPKQLHTAGNSWHEGSWSHRLEYATAAGRGQASLGGRCEDACQGQTRRSSCLLGQVPLRLEKTVPLLRPYKKGGGRFEREDAHAGAVDGPFSSPPFCPRAGLVWGHHGSWLPSLGSSWPSLGLTWCVFSQDTEWL